MSCNKVLLSSAIILSNARHSTHGMPCVKSHNHNVHTNLKFHAHDADKDTLTQKSSFGTSCGRAGPQGVLEE